MRAPQCRNAESGTLHGQDMWIAIEAQDAEAAILLEQTSKGGIYAAMEWCGLEIVTDNRWRCNKVAGPNWQVGW